MNIEHMPALRKCTDLRNKEMADRMQDVYKMIGSQFNDNRTHFLLHSTIYCALDETLKIFAFMNDTIGANAEFKRVHKKDITYFLEIHRTGISTKFTHYSIVDHASKDVEEIREHIQGYE